MSTHKLPFRLIFKDAAIILLLLVNCLLLLRYVLFVGHYCSSYSSVGSFVSESPC